MKAQQKDLAIAAAREERTTAKRKHTHKPKGAQASATQSVFDSNIIKNAQAAREQIKKQVAPKTVPSINSDEQAQLVLQFNWDTVGRILQEESRLSVGDTPAIRWSSLKDIGGGEYPPRIPGSR